MQHYILNTAGIPEPIDDLDKWSEWYMSNHASHILDDTLPNGLRVKTGFVGREIKGDTVFWETNVFHGSHRESIGRYRSKDEAIAGHAKAVTWARRRKYD